MNVVVLDGYLVNHDRLPWAVAERFPDLVWYDETPDALAAQRIGDAEAVFVNRTRLDGPTLRRCPKLRYIGVFGTGYNIIDLSAAGELGITVCNVPEYSSYAVAQHAMALLLAVTNRAAEFSAYVKAGKWTLPADPGVTAVPMAELSGKTLGAAAPSAGSSAKPAGRWECGLWAAAVIPTAGSRSPWSHWRPFVGKVTCSPSTAP